MAPVLILMLMLVEKAEGKPTMVYCCTAPHLTSDVRLLASVVSPWGTSIARSSFSCC